MEAAREEGVRAVISCCGELPGLWGEWKVISCKGALRSLHFGHNLRYRVAWLPSPSPAARRPCSPSPCLRGRGLP